MSKYISAPLVREEIEQLKSGDYVFEIGGGSLWMP